MLDPELRLRLKKSELRERLGPTCAHWPAELFESMLDELARITIKFDGVSSVPIYDRRSTDRLVDDLRSALDRSNARREDTPPTESGGTPP